MKKILGLLASMAIGLGLGGCGGSGGDGGAGAAGGTASTSTATVAATPAVSQGTVTGFGSIIVDGDRISDTSATVQLDGDAGLAAAGSSVDVKLGQHVEVDRASSGEAQVIRVTPELIGPVSALATADQSFTVDGVTITTNADANAGPVTVWDGYTAYSDMKVGDRVEVHGYPVVASTGTITIRATRVELRPASTAVLVSGVISAYSSTAGTFDLAGLTITVNTGTRILPGGATLANGEYVGVFASGGIQSGGATATAIRVRKAGATGATLRTAGVVTGFTAATSTFTLQGLTVDASAATLSPSTASLADNAYVVVTGTYDATAGTLKASSVRILKTPSAPPVELHGTITDFVDPTSFKVRGVLVDASSAVVTGGTLATLANNVAVEIHGTIAGGLVKAATVDIQSAASQSVVDYTGVIQSVDTTGGTLTLKLVDGSSVTVVIATSTLFEPKGRTLANAAVGTLARVRGSFNGSTFTASRISLWGRAQTAASSIDGIVRSITPASGNATSFSIGPLTFQVVSATLPAGFAVGAKVEVQFTRSGTTLTATSVELDD